MQYLPTYKYNTIDELSVLHDFNTSRLTKWLRRHIDPFCQTSLSSHVLVSYSSCPHTITLNLGRRKRKKKGLRVCTFVFTEWLMLLLWALSSTLNISVYNVEREGGGGEVPVIPESSKAEVSTRQKEADGSSFCFGKACRAVCLNLNICGGQIHLLVKLLRMMSWIWIDSYHDSKEKKVCSFMNNMSPLHFYLSCCLIKENEYFSFN